VEFLPDELVEYDREEFVPDEFVLDDVAPDSSVGFAGPSDAPPPHPAVQQPVTASWRPRERATRRAKTTRLGWIATALAAIFGLVAITRLGLIAATHSEAPQAAAMAAPLDPPAMPPPVMSSLPAPSEPSVSPSVATEAADALVALDAVDLKHRAQQALEKGKLAAALDLGQQAVDADPTDAESWLILGATYLQRAKYKDARKCFSSCVDQATQGPVSECKALLR
jgi:cytochrome c-type biogenesis protein CcmH/NrfG